MTYHDEHRRKLNEASVNRTPHLSSGIEWGLPLGIAGPAIVIGLIFFNINHQPTTTASHTGLTATQSAPAPNAEKAAPPKQ